MDAFTPLNWFFWALAVAALIVEVWAFADAIRRPTAAFPAANKQTKSLWLIILGVAAAIGLYSATRVSGIGVVVSILPVAAFIAAAIYLTDVRPKVREIGRGGSSHHGPYGPW
ncbi:MAG TPA: DUF2516 family protein [Streptosporangiaceae bacterium]|nr:DUF2516 family protein [Streptosporangiaceae bacterium]